MKLKDDKNRDTFDSMTPDKLYEWTPFKRLVALGILFVFTLHFLMVTLHNIPEKYLSARMESYSHLWCYPAFHQGWALFAPEPQPKHKRMEFRFHSAEDWSTWHKAESICEDEHQSYRITHYSKLCHVTQNTAYHLWRAADAFDNQELSQEAFYPNEMGYAIAVHYAESWAHHYSDVSEELDSVQIRLILEAPFEDEEDEIIYFPSSEGYD